MIKEILELGYNVFKGTIIAKIPGLYPLFIKIYKRVSGEYVTYFNGIKLMLTEVDTRPLWYAMSNYESGVTKLFTKLIKPGMTVVDVGAAIGYYTLIAAKLVGNSGRVYAFEPIKSVYEVLCSNVKLNNFTNVKAYNVAVSNRDGNVEVTVENTLKSVPSTKLDSILSDCDLVKIDVEGMELMVLEGMTNTIRKNKPIIICEVHPRLMRDYGYSSTDINKFLRKVGYSSFLIEDDGLVESEVRRDKTRHYVFCRR
ncbi:hypothetical protein DRO97_02640 [Archaeoglobales archaeon]|nr:MAG: hypothetical protein DRO97_02640 [Archaeoglobales archaeon]